MDLVDKKSGLIIIFSLIGLMTISFIAGSHYQKNYVYEDYEVETVALCDKIEHIPDDERNWKCNDHIILKINDYKTSIHEMPQSFVYRNEPVNKNYLGDISE